MIGEELHRHLTPTLVDILVAAEPAAFRRSEDAMAPGQSVGIIMLEKIEGRPPNGRVAGSGMQVIRGNNMSRSLFVGCALQHPVHRRRRSFLPGYNPVLMTMSVENGHRTVLEVRCGAPGAAVIGQGSDTGYEVAVPAGKIPAHRPAL